MLRDDVSQMPKNWNRRFKHNRDKIKTGDIYELAEVVRNLAIRESDKGLSTGEKQMFTRAKKILASELMYALEMDEDEAEAYLDDLLERGARAAQRRRRGGEVAHRSDGRRRDRSRPPAAASALAPTAQGVRRCAAAGRCWTGGSTCCRRSATGSSCALPPGVRGARRARVRGRRVALAVGARRAGRGAEARRGRRARRRAAARDRELVRARASRRSAGCDGAIAAAPVTDTIKEADAAGRVLRTLDRSRAVGGADAAGVPRRGAARARSTSTPRRARRGHRRRLAGRAPGGTVRRGRGARAENFKVTTRRRTSSSPRRCCER